jgi:hypothetical protein
MKAPPYLNAALCAVALGTEATKIAARHCRRDPARAYPAIRDGWPPIYRDLKVSAAAVDDESSQNK